MNGYDQDGIRYPMKTKTLILRPNPMEDYTSFKDISNISFDHLYLNMVSGEVSLDLSKIPSLKKLTIRMCGAGTCIGNIVKNIKCSVSKKNRYYTIEVLDIQGAIEYTSKYSWFGSE